MLSLPHETGQVVTNHRLQRSREPIINCFFKIDQQQLVIGHLKFFIETPGWKRKISITAMSPVSYYLPEENTSQVKLLINARVQTEPENLQKIVHETLKQIVQKHDAISR